MLICPVCQNDSWTEVYKIKEWSIGECTSCGFARIDPLPLRENRHELYSQEQVVTRNIKQLSHPQQFSRAMKRLFKKLTRRDKSKIFFKLLCRYLPEGSKILDIGCGDGSFLRSAQARFRGTGIEISQYLADLARKEAGIKVLVGDFLNAPLGEEKFDGITLISLLEHLDYPEKALQKCFDLLNGRGVLLLKTVNYGCLNRIIKKGNWTGFRPPDHVVYFTPRNLRRLLKKIGFSQIKISSWALNDNMYCDARK